MAHQRRVEQPKSSTATSVPTEQRHRIVPNAAGFHGRVAETVAINPAVAISGIELINQWYYNPAYLAITAGLQQHRHRGVVGKQPGPHGRGGRVRTA